MWFFMREIFVATSVSMPLLIATVWLDYRWRTWLASKLEGGSPPG
jgi:hypothetical protein